MLLVLEIGLALLASVCWWAGAGAQVAGPGEKDGLNNRTQTETDEIQ